MCYPPCEAEQPKEAQPTEPRAAVPGIAPGVFVAPPQTGVIEGPSHGFEIGNMSLTLPEITLGLPRLRWEGARRFSRDARMMTDRAAAPYVANPYYAAAAAAAADRQAQETPREAKPSEGEKHRDARREPGSVQKTYGDPDGQKGTSAADLQARLEYLEACLQQQMEILRSCAEELKTTHAASGADQDTPAFVPTPAPCEVQHGAAVTPLQMLQPLSAYEQAVIGREIRPVDYQVDLSEEGRSISAPLRRLPATFPTADRPTDKVRR